MNKGSCRVCLNEYIEKEPIDEVFVQAYNMLTNLNVYLNDGLSQYVCYPCKDMIQTFIEFRNKCVDVECYQRKLLEKSKLECADSVIKVEIEDECTVQGQTIDASFDDPFHRQESENENKEDIKVEIRKCTRKSKRKATEIKVKKNKTAEKEVKNEVKIDTTETEINNRVKEEVKKEIKDSELLCGLCTIKFKDQKLLLDHLEGHKETYYCLICEKPWNRWFNALAHRAVHTKKMACHICDKKQTNVKGLALHYQRVHKIIIPSDLQCKICMHTFKSLRRISKHEASFHSNKIFTCDYCSKTFRTKPSIRSHLKIHTDTRDFKCDLCDFTTKRYTGLKEHQLRKHTAGIVKCAGCLRMFENKEKKDQHKCNSGKVCNICGKIFLRNANGLRAHMRTHTTERNFKCDRCPSAFKTKDSLKKHIERHEGIRKHKCEFCPLSFVCGPALIKHRRTHTGERPYPCKQCGKAFKTNYNLKIHMQVHGEYLVKKRNAEPETPIMMC